MACRTMLASAMVTCLSVVTIGHAQTLSLDAHPAAPNGQVALGQADSTEVDLKQVDLNEAGMHEPRSLSEEPDRFDPDRLYSEEAELQSGDDEHETIKERYPNGSVKVQREVTQDAEGNYVNHGTWKMWDTRGGLIGEGRYRYGRRHGTWNRWYQTSDASILSRPPFDGFSGPFVSQATFDNGNLHGKWVIYDNKLRKMSEWEFAHGERHGQSVWWYADGRKMRQVDYRDGVIDGELLEWSPDGKLVVHENYREGRKLAAKVTHHGSQQKQTEGMYLFAKIVVQQPDDWWNLRPAVYTREGADEKHGPWTAWYATGQQQMQGDYRHDVSVGTFTWWYANGQKAVQGDYDEGMQHGRWTWWHENGQKASEGEFARGNRIGQWMWWHADGKVSRRSEFTAQGERITTTGEPALEALLPETLPARPQLQLKR